MTELRDVLLWGLLILALVVVMLTLQGCEAPCGRPPFPCP